MNPRADFMSRPKWFSRFLADQKKTKHASYSPDAW